MLSRFGSEGQGVALDKLGGVAWQSRKARMKQRIRDMAGQLIRIAAARKIRDAAIMAPGEGAWDEFCARFPFAETEDQSRAIADVLEDLAVGRPMDRLICGDVGFGKTEVALRAAFVAAMSGAQVAVVVPTTLLARQHYRTFSERFAGLPVKVAQLSRMVTAKEAAEVRRGITDGSINIVIGTHALLAKSVEFADLGLLVVDEEQHFGVAHKERLKQLKADVHVLTLTATPIPRTLQLALTGVREMSLIATPPVDRLAVRTFIMPFDGVVIREALQRERFRGGQVFCVVPRIEDLPRMAERLAEIVPEARMAQAHGRLAPTELERVMAEFGDGHYDILLSTNIVESGLDMPAVNTLVIHRADMFGLGQLYQLRGRVGRGKQRGYAYLTWPPNLRLSVAAEKRLTVMQTLDALGAGFTLASHDLDIRGAGNLLGDEQSGPYPRSRHRAVPADAGGRGRGAARRRGPPRRAGTRLDAEHLAWPAGADPGGLRARPAGPARPVSPHRRAGLGRGDRGDGGGAGRSLRPAAAGGGEPASGGGAEARLPRGGRGEAGGGAQGHGAELPRQCLLQSGGTGVLARQQGRAGAPASRPQAGDLARDGRGDAPAFRARHAGQSGADFRAGEGGIGVVAPSIGNSFRSVDSADASSRPPAVADPRWMKPALTVMAGLVPAIGRGTLPLRMAGTKPAMTVKVCRP